MILFSKKNIPNYLAILRVLLAIPIVVLLLLKVKWATILASSIWLVAGLTDALDGYLSRKWQVQSAVGALLDTSADKILVLSIMIFLCYQQKLDPFIVIILMTRDIYLSSLRATASHQGFSFSVLLLAKWKTATQIIGMFLFLLGLALSTYLHYLGYCLMWVSALLSVLSAIYYTRYFMKNSS